MPIQIRVTGRSWGMMFRLQAVTGYMLRSINGGGYAGIASQSASVEHGVAQGWTSISGNFVITYVENLASLGNFDILSYAASGGGTILVTLNN